MDISGRDGSWVSQRIYYPILGHGFAPKKICHSDRSKHRTKLVCHSERSKHRTKLVCHSERSVAESKNLRLLLPLHFSRGAPGCSCSRIFTRWDLSLLSQLHRRGSVLALAISPETIRSRILTRGIRGHQASDPCLRTKTASAARLMLSTLGRSASAFLIPDSLRGLSLRKNSSHQSLERARLSAVPIRPSK